MRDTYRIFLGALTGQLDTAGRPAIPDAWYYEPFDYDGDILWSAPHTTCERAFAAAELAS